MLLLSLFIIILNNKNSPADRRGFAQKNSFLPQIARIYAEIPEVISSAICDISGIKKNLLQQIGTRIYAEKLFSPADCADLRRNPRINFLSGDPRYQRD